MADGAPRKGREGSRWINERPSGEDLAAWFKENVLLHEDMEHGHYVQGITLIPQKEKAREVVGFGNDNTPLIKEVENMVYIPYAKVETRVKYFHDLMAINPDWLGMIEPVEVEGGKSKGYPPGFFSMAIEGTGNKKGNTTRFLCCSQRVRIFKRDTVKVERRTIDKRTGEEEFITTGELILDAPPGTKMVSLNTRYGDADENVLMKAETGAIGRALALAGMLVIPGTGVASAEDMVEAGQGDQPVPAAPPEAAQTPVPEADPEQVKGELLRAASAGIATLRTDHPEAYKAFADWGRQRGIGKLEELDATALRGLTTKVEKMLQDAREGAA